MSYNRVAAPQKGGLAQPKMSRDRSQDMVGNVVKSDLTGNDKTPQNQDNL